MKTTHDRSEIDRTIVEAFYVERNQLANLHRDRLLNTIVISSTINAGIIGAAALAVGEASGILRLPVALLSLGWAIYMFWALHKAKYNEIKIRSDITDLGEFAAHVFEEVEKMNYSLEKKLNKVTSTFAYMILVSAIVFFAWIICS